MAGSEPLLAGAGQEQPVAFVEEETMKPKRGMAEVCRCGNKFMDDAMFCRKCGQKRPEVISLVGNTSPRLSTMMTAVTEMTLEPFVKGGHQTAAAQLSKKEKKSHRRRSALDFVLGQQHPWVPHTMDNHVAEGKHFRLFDRASHSKAEFGQRRRANVLRINRSIGLFLNDTFHIFLEIPTKRFLALFWLVYVVVFLLFALVYWLASDRCGLGCKTFADALFLSVETMMTIGYGVPDPFFKSCPWLLGPILLQMLLSVSLDGSLVGIVYQRISQGSRRSSSVLFSRRAVIRTIGEASYFMMQVCDMRNLQLLECQVRLYCFMCPFDKSEPDADLLRLHSDQVPIEMTPIRTDEPDDSLGGMLLLAFPTTIAHRIDAWSPLHGGLCSDCNMDRSSPLVPPQRASENDAGCRYSVSCPVCGDCFARIELLHLHVRYYARPAANDAAHAALLERLPSEPSVQEVREEVKRVLSSRFVEIVCILEGVDQVTGNSVQARHSYAAEDIVWDHRFADCVFDDVFQDGDKCVRIDFARFHDLVPDREAP